MTTCVNCGGAARIVASVEDPTAIRAILAHFDMSVVMEEEIKRWTARRKKAAQAPPVGYRTVPGLLAMNKNTVQRIFQIKGWQVRKRVIGSRPRIEALGMKTPAEAYALAT